MDPKVDIIRAIKDNNIESFRTLLNSIENAGDNSFTLIDIFSNNIQYNQTEKIPLSGVSILHAAACYNSLQCFQYLYKENQMPLRHLSSQKLLPLHYAIYSGSKDVALYILSEDPEESVLHPEENNKLSLLFCAVYSRNLDILNELFKNGAKLSDPWNDETAIIDYIIERFSSTLLSLIWSHHSPLPNNKESFTYAMKCVLKHDVGALKIIYNKEYDLDKYHIDRSGYHSLISLIADIDARHIFKDIYLQILDDAKEMTIEPPAAFNEGVCHWCCMYLDLDVAKKMFQTKNVQIHRFDKYKHTGPFKLAEKRRSPEVISMIKFLVERGFDVNLRYDSKSPTLLEYAIMSIRKNYELIETLIEIGADINAFHSKHKSKDGKPMTLLEFVRQRGDRQLKQIFENSLDLSD